MHICTKVAAPYSWSTRSIPYIVTMHTMHTLHTMHRWQRAWVRSAVLSLSMCQLRQYSKYFLRRLLSCLVWILHSAFFKTVPCESTATVPLWHKMQYRKRKRVKRFIYFKIYTSRSWYQIYYWRRKGVNGFKYFKTPTSRCIIGGERG